jgi:hypothetical protein
MNNKRKMEKKKKKKECELRPPHLGFPLQHGT